MSETDWSVEVLDGPDHQGQYGYVLHWMADYHPGDPRGEYRHAKRGQVFHKVPPDWVRALPGWAEPAKGDA